MRGGLQAARAEHRAIGSRQGFSTRGCSTHLNQGPPKDRHMTQPAPTRVDRRERPRCRDCGATMRLFGIEAHPTIDRTELLTYVCSQCDRLQTQIKPHGKLKVIPLRRTVMPIDTLLKARAFDPETTLLLGSTFDEAWKSF